MKAQEPRVRMTKVEQVNVNTRHVSCDGGKGSLGHPKVYYEIKKDTNKVRCGYCGKTFIYKE